MTLKESGKDHMMIHWLDSLLPNNQSRINPIWEKLHKKLKIILNTTLLSSTKMKSFSDYTIWLNTKTLKFHISSKTHGSFLKLTWTFHSVISEKVLQMVWFSKKDTTGLEIIKKSTTWQEDLRIHQIPLFWDHCK